MVVEVAAGAGEAAVVVAGVEMMNSFADKVGLGWRADLAAGIFTHLDRIDLLEVIADDFPSPHGSAAPSLRQIATCFSIFTTCTPTA